MTIDYRPIPPPPPNRLKQIEATLLADLKPVRPLAPAGAYFAALMGIFVALCVIGCVTVGQNGWRALSELQKLGVFLPLAAVTAILAFSIVRQMTPASAHARSSALISVGLFVVLLLIMALIFQPSPESAFVRRGLVCFQIGMLFALPAACLFTLLLRRGAGLSPVLTGATAGGLTGLVGLAVLELQCPDLNVYHIVVWHVSVTLLCVMAGLIFSSVTFRRWTSNH